MVKKQGIRRTVLTLSILSVLAIFLVSAGLLCRSLYEYRKGEKEYGELRQYTAKASGQEPDPQSPGSLPAGEQEPMLAVDFEALKKLNPHIIAWIHIPGTPVSYPVTRGEDNSYYLTRTFSGAYNGAGCIFMDYRSSLPSEGGNTVLYGHNMKNGSMFGLLKKYKDQSYYEANQFFWIYTPQGDYMYQIFSCHEAEPESETYTNGFGSKESYASYLQTIKDLSLYDTGVAVTSDDKIVSLSTCTKDKGVRFVVHAKRL